IIQEGNVFPLKHSAMLLHFIEEFKKNYPFESPGEAETNHFLSELNAYATTYLKEINWNYLLILLQKDIIVHIKNQTVHKQIINLFGKAHSLISKIFQKQQSASQILISKEDRNNRDFKEDLNFIDKIEDCCRVLAEHCERARLNRAYMVLYDGKAKKKNDLYHWDIPEKSRLLMAWDKGKQHIAPQQEIKFNTVELLPDEFFQKEEQFILAITSLYYRTNQYGYLVVGLNQRDEFYITTQEYLGSALYHIEEWEKRLLLEKEKKETLEKLQISNEKLTELDDMKNDFIANITHDFRSPLSIILNTADIGMKYEAQLNREQIKKRFTTTYLSALKLKQATDRLLDLAKMDSEGLKLKIQKVKPKFFLTQLLDYYKSSILSSDFKILESMPPYEIDDFYTDIDKLEEILSNIVSNAIKYIDSDKGEVIIYLEDKPDSIQIKIEDNGIGIERNMLESIFNRFEQVESGRNSIYKGTGLGLSFAKQLTELLQGTIRAESEGKDKGTTFILEFRKGKENFDSESIEFIESGELIKTKNKPNYISVELEEKKRNEYTEIESLITEMNDINEFNHKKGLILIVDDNPEIREIEKSYLRNNGFINFITACDGLQGLDAAYEYRPDFIICDFNMPRMRGDAFHDNLISNPDFKKLPIIFVTALADRNLLIDRQRKGAVAYLGKPIEEDEFITTIDIHMKKYMEYKEILVQATIDELTNINNRRNLMKTLNKILTIRTKRDLSIVFFDIDHFKIINDTYGHPMGDKVLTSLGEIINDNLRPYDTAGRYGGEEFMLLLSDTSLDQAQFVADKFRKKFKDLLVEEGDLKVKITVSFGIASLLDDEKYICRQLGIDSLSEIYEITDTAHTDWKKVKELKQQLNSLIVEMADQALYMAKSTICHDCSFKSEKTALFIDDKCPECGSRHLTPGRDKIVTFSEISD
ncbi:MAG: diguanylate cyclase, partial [Spirochaetaceae bacterium]|nr:diguanylate cyclase [Spirochaetaceae bacterium]